MEQNHEFEEMKRQLELLKEKLDRQTIINDKMLRGKLKNVSRTINYSAYATLLIALVMTPTTYIIFNRELQLPLYCGSRSRSSCSLELLPTTCCGEAYATYSSMTSLQRDRNCQDSVADTCATR